MQNKTMLTDLYQITMNAVYFAKEKDDTATFDLFIRKLPKDWGYFVANGIEDAIEYITHIHFDDSDIEYLRSLGKFDEKYLAFLKDFKFRGEVYAVKEGTVMFPNEPLLRVTAKRSQAQFVESALLNMINFQTLISSKASRIVEAAKPAGVIEFGLRRAQESEAALKGARAAYIAGYKATSNVLAGKMYGIPVGGTHAHSLVMSFGTELEAFLAYADIFPDKPTLLIDTYNVMEGAKNAGIVAKVLEQKGKKLGAVRLDSGDLCLDSKMVRSYFDSIGLSYVSIFASNDLNEYKIDDFGEQGACINDYGVGTEGITAKPVSAISGVYKLVEDTDGGKIKLSADKQTNPGKKQVYRVRKNGLFEKDILALEVEHINGIPLLECVVRNGESIAEKRSLNQIRAYALSQVAMLPTTLRGVYVTETYPVELSHGLEQMIAGLKQKYNTEVKA
jgi:nicotinate phosphoribosyltransferase